MRLFFLALLMLIASRHAVAQPLLDTLAARVCDCMAAAPEIVYPRMQASRCVLSISTAYAGRIRSELQLSGSTSRDRRRLSELLVDPLTRNCPLLQQLGPGIVEPELSYSDRELLEQQAPTSTAKRPAADPPKQLTREVVAMHQVQGTVTEDPRDSDRLRILLTNGQVHTFALPRNLARRRSFSRGQSLSFVYYEDWRTDAQEMQYVIVRLVE